MPSLNVVCLRRWQLLLLIFLSLNLLVLVGCSPDAASLEATVDVQAGQIAAATVAAWPTETSAATLTPLPSLTSRPSLTPQPTFTSQPTLTPLPTLSPQPTLTQPPTPTATATPTATSTRVPVTAAPPQSAFSVNHVLSVYASMAMLVDAINGDCVSADAYGHCQSRSYILDCPHLVGLIGQFDGLIVYQPGSSNPQTIAYHDRYLAVVSAFRTHISGYVTACQDALANNSEYPSIPLGHDYNLTVTQYQAFGALASDMENNWP